MALRQTKFGIMQTIPWRDKDKVAELFCFFAEGSDHTHDEWENAVCISGESEIIIEGTVFDAPLNHVFSIPPHTPHRMRPVGKGDCDWLLWYSDRRVWSGVYKPE